MLAIVIPYFKRTFFEETLQTLANQTDKQFHVYIGDDASPEPIEDLLESFKGQFEFSFKRFETNLGGTSLVQQWERCIAMVQDEEWIMILGDDDVLGDNVVEAFYENIEEVTENNINVIRYLTLLLDEISQKKTKNYLYPVYEKASDFLIRKINGQTRVSLSEYVFSKKIYNKYGFREYNYAWHSDEMAVLEFSENNYIYTINDSTVTIRYSNLSLSGNQKILKEKHLASINFYKDITRKIDIFFENDPEKIKIIKLKQRFVIASYGLYQIKIGNLCKGIFKVLVYNNWFHKGILKIKVKKIVKALLIGLKIHHENS